MSRITKAISYNLNDRGRKHTGKDRSNVSVPAMIAKINSPQIQEQVELGSLNGFCGHQIRQRYGMIPPETAEIDGRFIPLEPATRTVYLKADPDGTVTHRQEFYENQMGEHVKNQYQAKIGGFSTAVNYLIDGNTLVPNVFGGFDYVFAPNFAENASIGLFDSATLGDSLEIVHSMLEGELVALYDSIHESNFTYDRLNAMTMRAKKAEQALQMEKIKQQRRIKQAQQQKIDEFDSALMADLIPFEVQLMQANEFLKAEIEKPEHKKTAQEQKQETMFSAFGRFLGVGGQ